MEVAESREISLIQMLYCLVPVIQKMQKPLAKESTLLETQLCRCRMRMVL
jgi:hypothetical protein